MTEPTYSEQLGAAIDKVEREHDAEVARLRDYAQRLDEAARNLGMILVAIPGHEDDFRSVYTNHGLTP